MGLAGEPEEEAQDDWDLVEEAGEWLDELEQLCEGELVVCGRHRWSCFSEVCADRSASVDMFIILGSLVGLSKPSDLDVDVALVEAGRGAQFVQDVIVDIFGLDVVGGRESGWCSSRLQVFKVLVMHGLAVAIWELAYFDGIGSLDALSVV